MNFFLKLMEAAEIAVLVVLSLGGFVAAAACAIALVFGRSS
jgi:hypothetical protein